MIAFMNFLDFSVEITIIPVLNLRNYDGGVLPFLEHVF